MYVVGTSLWQGGEEWEKENLGCEFSVKRLKGGKGKVVPTKGGSKTNRTAEVR